MNRVFISDTIQKHFEETTLAVADHGCYSCYVTQITLSDRNHDIAYLSFTVDILIEAAVTNLLDMFKSFFDEWF